jgi:hypothetical protein
MNDERTSAFFGASTLGLTLLRAGRDEWPSDAAVSRTIAAVGAGAAVVAVASGAAGASAAVATAKSSVALVSFGSVMKWLGMGALGGIVVAGVAHGVTPAPARAPIVLPSPVVAPLAPTPAVAEEPKPERTVELAASEPIVEAPKPSAPPPAVERAANDALERKAPLAAEVAMVDRARASLVSGRPARALEELRGYETAFPEPRLEPEVLFLRMEAHLAAGDTARARQTAEQSVRLFPKSPHAAKARSLLEAASSEEK